MSKPNPQTTAISALSFEIIPQEGNVPTFAHLLPSGPFRSNDGRPAECAAWQLDADIAGRVIARLAGRKIDTVIDYEHQTLNKERNGKPAPAAGWFNQAEWREKGLYAINIRWTARAQKLISDREYRYISTVFLYDTVTGEVLELFHVALTNTPAQHQLDALVALSNQLYGSLIDKGDAGMSGNNKEVEVAALTTKVSEHETTIAALTTKVGEQQTAIATLTQTNKDLQAKVDGFEKEKKDAAEAAEEEKHTALLTAALTDGRLTPAQKPWAEKQSLAALTEYLEATAPLDIAGGTQTGGRAATGVAALTADEKEMADKMGVSHEDFLKTKEQQKGSGV